MNEINKLINKLPKAKRKYYLQEVKKKKEMKLSKEFALSVDSLIASRLNPQTDSIMELSESVLSLSENVTKAVSKLKDNDKYSHDELTSLTMSVNRVTANIEQEISDNNIRLQEQLDTLFGTYEEYQKADKQQKQDILDKISISIKTLKHDADIRLNRLEKNVNQILVDPRFATLQTKDNELMQYIQLIQNRLMGIQDTISTKLDRKSYKPVMITPGKNVAVTRSVVNGQVVYEISAKSNMTIVGRGGSSSGGTTLSNQQLLESITSEPTGELVRSGFIKIQGGTVTRNSTGAIIKIVYDSGRTVDITRDSSDTVLSYTDSIHTWTLVRDGSNNFSSWNVS